MGREDAIAALFADTLQQLEELGRTPELEERSRKKEKEKKQEKKAQDKKPQEKPEKAQKKEAPEKEAPDNKAPEKDVPFPDVDEDPMPDVPDAFEEEAESAPKDVPSHEEASPEAEEASFGKVRFGRSGKKLGEKVTKEHAEKLSEKPEGGFRGTIIIHRKVVDTSGNLLDEDREIKGAAKEEQVQKEPEEKRAEEKKVEPEAPSVLLIREDTGEAFELKGSMSVGRDAGNDIVIPDPEGHYVSSHHADITADGREIRLRDADSTNGTFVNGKKIKSKRIYPGNSVRFADIEFKVIER